MNALEQAAVDYFLREAVAKARSLPMAEARKFLHGLLVLCPELSNPEIRRAFQWLASSDDQLGQIAGGQMKLTFSEGES